MTPARAFAAALSGLALALSLSACSQDTAESNEAFCSSAAATQSEVDQLEAMVSDGTSTRDQIEIQYGSVTASAKNMLLDASDLAEAVQTDLKAADEAFADAIAAIPDDATVAEAATAFQAAIQSWNAAAASIRSEVGCS